MGQPPPKANPLNTAISLNAPMESYFPYVQSIQELAAKALRKGLNQSMSRAVFEVLDGQPGKVLRETVPYDVRKKFGVFASGNELSARVVNQLLQPGSTYLDPACGTGDLLLACARRLPICQDLQDTLTSWGGRIKGFDLHSELVQVAKARLVLLASTLFPSSAGVRNVDYDALFPEIRQSDGLKAMEDGILADNIVLNPPFSAMGPSLSDWSSGRVSSAAVFISTCLATAEDGTQISAVLPDVLRAGSRYEKWRRMVERRVSRAEVSAIGLFDKWCDVDVFLLRAIVGPPTAGISRISWAGYEEEQPYGNVGDRFRVRVGPVVPHRHKESGLAHRYIFARGLPIWVDFEIERASHRRFSGTTFKPPFVVVRRTSRPNSSRRALATVVVGSDPVAIENHLLVLLPVDGTYSSCKELIRNLRDTRSDSWLDHRIRCRHLTVGALQELPWWSDAETDFSLASPSAGWDYD